MEVSRVAQCNRKAASRSTRAQHSTEREREVERERGREVERERDGRTRMYTDTDTPKRLSHHHLLPPLCVSLWTILFVFAQTAQQRQTAGVCVGSWVAELLTELGKLATMQPEHMRKLARTHGATLLNAAKAGTNVLPHLRVSAVQVVCVCVCVSECECVSV